MSINFVQLFQQSWNFMRNQTHFTLVGLALLAGLQIVNLVIFPPIHATATTANPNEAALALNLPSVVASALINVFVTILLILNIKAINRGEYHGFFRPLPATLRAIGPVIVLMMLMVLPLSIGVSSGVLALQNPSMSLVSLLLMISGGYIFVKFCLLVYVYLIEEPQKSLGETIKFTWLISRGKMLILMLFCLIVYLLPLMISNQFARLGEIGVFLAQLVSAVLSLYFVIFSFRFYLIYRDLNA